MTFRKGMPWEQGVKSPSTIAASHASATTPQMPSNNSGMQPLRDAGRKGTHSRSRPHHLTDHFVRMTAFFHPGLRDVVCSSNGRAASEPREVSVCWQPPGFDANLLLRADVLLLYRAWAGHIDYHAAARRGEIVGDVPCDLARALAGAIRADLESIGKPIGAYGLLIAGQAMCNKLTLITANLSEFVRIKALTWADWGKP
jgi:hypothetical protein